MALVFGILVRNCDLVRPIRRELVIEYHLSYLILDEKNPMLRLTIQEEDFTEVIESAFK